MKSRTLFFNLTALRKDITRFAPVWALYLIGGLLVGLSTLSSNNIAYGYGAKELAATIGPMAVVNMVYAIINAELLFGDLFNNRLCNALHAFPLRRESWFATHTVAGLLFSLGPNLILSVIFLPFMGEMWYISPLWLLGVTLEYLFFFGLGALSAMCTGNRFAMAAVYALINFGSMIAYWFVDTFYAPLLYGLHIRETGFLRLCPSVWITELNLVEFHREQIIYPSYNYDPIYGSSYVNDIKFIYKGLSADWWYLAILTVVGVALLGAAVLLYRRRKLECAGDFVAFSWLKPVFSVVFTLSMGAMFELFGDLFLGADYVFLAVGIIVGYFVGQMLLQRTVRVFRKKAFAACAAIGGALVVSIALTALDPFGVTRWTPKPEKVESIVLSDAYSYDPKYYSRNVQTITSPALIEDLVQIHGQILEEGEWDGRNSSGAIHLTYQMSDGRRIERRYCYNAYGEAAEALKKFFGAPEFVLGYQDWGEFVSSVKSVNVDGTWSYSKQASGLLEAIKADCEAGTMVQNLSYESVSYWVEIETDDNFMGLSVYSDCENTIKWIKENLKLEE